MTSSDSNKELFKLLGQQLDNADDLMETWLARPRKSKASDTPEPSRRISFPFPNRNFGLDQAILEVSQ